MEMTNEKILHVKAKWNEMGFTEFPENFDIVEAFKELREWFKWDMKKYPYDNITNPIKCNENYPEINYKLKDSLHDATVMSIIGILNYAENHDLTNNLNYEKIDKIIYGFDSSYICDGDLDGYYNYFKVLLDIGVGATDSSYIGGTIRNRMGTDDFETFFRKYKDILQKYTHLGNLANDPSVTTINTTATTVVEPKYIPADTGVTERVKAKYGFIPAAYSALQCNPIGLWYTHQQTGQQRSKFINYNNRAFYCYYAQDLINNINKAMSNRNVYEKMLKLMPIIGTEFINTKPVLLDFLGFSRSSNAYILGACYGNHTFIIKVDIKSNKFIIDCGLNDDINRKIDDYFNE